MKHCFPIMQYVSVLKPYNCDLTKSPKCFKTVRFNKGEQSNA